MHFCSRAYIISTEKKVFKLRYSDAGKIVDILRCTITAPVLECEILPETAGFFLGGVYTCIRRLRLWMKTHSNVR